MTTRRQLPYVLGQIAETLSHKRKTCVLIRGAIVDATRGVNGHVNPTQLFLARLLSQGAAHDGWSGGKDVAGALGHHRPMR